MGNKRINIAVLVTGVDSEAQAEILKGIEDYGKANDCNIAVFLWFTGAYERDKHNLGEMNIANLPDFNLFDGIILFSNTLHLESNRKHIQRLLEQVSCPVVCVGAKVADYYYVGTDGYSAMRKLVEHFVKDHKMNRLHFVKGIEGNADAETRYRAYVDVLTENGIPVSQERVSQGDFYVIGAELAAKEILNSKISFPQAIICANDVMAMTICDILKEKGYRIPEDVVISGYDCVTEGQAYHPSLTTIRTRFWDMGKTACRMVLDLLAGEEVPKEILLEDELVLGESCGCATNNLSSVKHHPLRSEVFQRKMIHQMIELEKSIMEIENHVDWTEALKGFISQIGPEEFYCCVNENFVESIFERGVMEQEAMSAEEKLMYTEKTKVLIAYQNGVFKRKSDFDSKMALDDIFGEAEKGKMYIFSPVHYLDRNYGYFVFVDNEFPIANQLYVNWLIHMGDSLENIRKQNMLKGAMARLEEMYIRDSLTGVYNRFGMERFFAEIKMKSMMSNIKMQLSFVDLDGLKEINDLHGHEEGDRIINATAEVLSKNCGKFYVIRYGGDEFIVMGIVQSEREVEEYWNHVHRNIKEYNEQNKKYSELSLSYGYEIFKMEPKTNLEDCIRIVDKKMYSQKNEKK